MSNPSPFAAIFPGYIGQHHGPVRPAESRDGQQHFLVVGLPERGAAHPLEDLTHAASMRENACTIHARRTPLDVKLRRLERTHHARQRGLLIAPLSLRGAIETLQVTRPWLQVRYLDTDLILTDERHEDLSVLVKQFYFSVGHDGPVIPDPHQGRDPVREILLEQLHSPSPAPHTPSLTPLIDVNGADHIEVAFDEHPGATGVLLLSVYQTLTAHAQRRDELDWQDLHFGRKPDVTALNDEDTRALNRIVTLHSDLTDWHTFNLPWIKHFGLPGALHTLINNGRTTRGALYAALVLYVPTHATGEAAFGQDGYSDLINQFDMHVADPAHLPDEELRHYAQRRVLMRASRYAPSRPRREYDQHWSTLTTPNWRDPWHVRLRNRLRTWAPWSLTHPQTFARAAERELQELRALPRDVFLRTNFTCTAGADLCVIPHLHAETMTRPPTPGEPLDRSAPPLPNPARQFRAAGG